jgi:hypothetical protein
MGGSPAAIKKLDETERTAQSSIAATPRRRFIEGLQGWSEEGTNPLEGTIYLIN